SWHDVETSFWEAVLSRGDRRLSRLIRRAWEKGAGFDGWAEWFRPGIWQEAGQECGIDPESIVYRQWPEEECLPWQVMDSGVSSRFFRRERELAARAETTPDCRTGICSACGLACKQGDENMVTIV
ncbi:MAG: hypothetical protein N3A57_08375, partial [Negativicutes bacterium]|nr:hypothetical protein [Negativicutes bacterium]